MWQSRVEIEDYSTLVKFEFLMANATLGYPLFNDQAGERSDIHALSYTDVNTCVATPLSNNCSTRVPRACAR
jgi:hypothetical protein